MVTVRLVRHGRAAAGWDRDPDPDLDDLGRSQARDVADLLAPLGPLVVITSPLARCRSTADEIARRWQRQPVVEPAVAEIPSPEGIPMAARVEWLRRAMTGTWSDLDQRYRAYRDDVVAAIRSIDVDAVVCSHFVAINAVIGACTGDDRVVIHRLDNCSVTVVEVTPAGLRLVESGREADTLIR